MEACESFANYVKVKGLISLWSELCPITTNILCSKTICWSWTHCQTQIVLGCNDLIAPLLKNIHCTRRTKANAGGCEESQHVPSFVYICCDAGKWFRYSKQSLSLTEKRSMQHKLLAEQMSFVPQYAPLQQRHTGPVTNGVTVSCISLHRAAHLFLNGDWRHQGTPP